MRSVRRSVGVISILAIMIAAQLGPTFAAPATPVRSPPSASVPWLDDLIREFNASRFFKAIAETIESRTGLSAVQSEAIVKELGCLIAKGTTSPEQVHETLLSSRQYAPVSFDQAIAISEVLTGYQQDHPILFGIAQQILQLVC